jgi:hypothetical protein
VILSFLKRERDFVIVSDRPTSLTVPERFMTVSELGPGLKKATNGEKRSRNFHGTFLIINNFSKTFLETFSNFKNFGWKIFCWP